MNTTSQDFGFSTRMFATLKPGGVAVAVGGMSDSGQRWIRLLTPRAAHLLWVQLAHCLFANADEIIAALNTTQLREVDLPTITSHVTVEIQLGSYILIRGISGERTWRCRLTDADARSFWVNLNRTLYSNDASIAAQTD